MFLLFPAARRSARPPFASSRRPPASARSASKSARGERHMGRGEDHQVEQPAWSDGPVLATGQWTTTTGYKDFNVTAAVSGGVPVSFLIRHAVGCNATGDVSFTSREATTNQPQLAVQTISGGAAGLLGRHRQRLRRVHRLPRRYGLHQRRGQRRDQPPADSLCRRGRQRLGRSPTTPPIRAAPAPRITDETNPPPAACAGRDRQRRGRVRPTTPPIPAAPAPLTRTRPIRVPAIVIVAAGDIACDPAASTFNGSSPEQLSAPRHGRTAGRSGGGPPARRPSVRGWHPGQFPISYDPSWGRSRRRRIRRREPRVPRRGRPGVLRLLGLERSTYGRSWSGYYSYDIGSWHLIALNSNCSPVKCVEGTLQNNFLEQDLANTTKPCILAYWHHPLFNSGSTGVLAGPKAFWDDLYPAGADIVLNGHIHNYQRFGKQNPAGQAIAERSPRIHRRNRRQEPRRHPEPVVTPTSSSGTRNPSAY